MKCISDFDIPLPYSSKYLLCIYKALVLNGRGLLLDGKNDQIRWFLETHKSYPHLHRLIFINFHEYL